MNITLAKRQALKLGAEAVCSSNNVYLFDVDMKYLVIKEKEGHLSTRGDY